MTLENAFSMEIAGVLVVSLGLLLLVTCILRVFIHDQHAPMRYSMAASGFFLLGFSALEVGYVLVGVSLIAIGIGVALVVIIANITALFDGAWSGDRV